MTEKLHTKPSYRRILSNRSLTFLWLGQLVSRSGDFIFDVALLWYVLQSTHSSFLVGVTLATELLPDAIIAPIAGVYADRINRKTLMLGSNIFQGFIALTLALLYSTGSLGFLALLLLVFLLMSGSQFFRPALSATIPRMATESDLLAANGLFTISTSLNQLAGYGLGGVIVAIFGVSLPIYYDSFTFFFAAIMFSFISRAYGEIGSSQASGSFGQRFREGLQFISGRKILLQLAIVAIIANFFGAATNALLAPYARQSLAGDAGTFGLILAAFSFGLILGSLALGKFNAKEHVGEILFIGVAIFGVFYGLLGFVSVPVFAMILVLIAGVANAIVNLPIQTLIQVTVPSNLLGRVFTSLSAIGSLSQPIASTVAGGTASYTTVNGGLEIFGFLMAASSIVTALFFKELRRARY